MKVYEQLKAKASRNFNYIDAHFYLFSKSGFTKGLVDMSKLDDHLHLYDLKDLMG